LFVAEAGINAVGVIDVKSNQVLGHIPVGWFPSKLKVAPDWKTTYRRECKRIWKWPQWWN